MNKSGESHETRRRLLAHVPCSRQASSRLDPTRNSAITFLTGITVAPITTTIRGVPSEVVLTPGQDGMFEECAVNAYNIQTIQKAHLGDFITRLPLVRMREIRAAIGLALGFEFW